jgi:plasmid stabilization system protein ParE
VAQARIHEAASWRLDEIYLYTREHWDEAQAQRYITGVFDSFDRIETQ